MEQRESGTERGTDVDPAAVPTVSVLMPVYNAGRYLRPAMDDVLAQTLGEFELIAVDDGSSDGSGAVLDEYARADGRVVVLRQGRQGLVAALNAGLARARGEFVARMDADDRIRADRFEKQVAFLRAHPDHVAVGSQSMLIDDRGLPICVKKDTRFTHEEIDAAHLDYGWPIVHAATTFRRSALLAVGGYRSEYQWLEDLDLFLRLAEVGRLGNLPDVLFEYRQSFSSVCYTRFEEQAEIRRRLYRELRDRRHGPGPAADDGPSAPRATPSRDPADLHLLWAWWALGAGHVRTARRHAAKRLRLRPFSRKSWVAAACAARGH